MSGTKEKYIIGLTGNIGTGKSVVRRMLGHLGAYGIDADVLGHRAIAQDAPGYQPVIKQFGRWIINSEGQIERARLAKIVFRDPVALKALEDIIHPLVNRAVELLIQRTQHQVVVIEAIKLFEGGLAGRCDTVWVSYTPEEIQVERLVERRKMTVNEARSRIRAQSSQTEKMSKADTVIMNNGSFEKVWKQVYKAWNRIPANIRPKETAVAATTKKISSQEELTANRLEAFRATPKETSKIAQLLTGISENGKTYSHEDIMESFGEKAYMLLKESDTEQVAGLLSWQVDNLITRVFEVKLRPEVFSDTAIRILFKKVEEESKLLQAEACMVFENNEKLSGDILKKLGYEKRVVSSLEANSWLEAAQEVMPDGGEFYLKPLRTQRVLRPL
ncbi:MAG: dephospho-CoA kinase [Anaerolineaceae bacterium]|nr:dephospho-CoA kinase [Anaerolineaceae bacterium]